LDIITGKYTQTKVLFRNDDFLVFDDKYGVSENHLDVIPTKVITDISSLTDLDIPMLEGLYNHGLNEFKSRQNVKEKFGDENLDDYITAGYNFPVSVAHLHLHMVLPPFKQFFYF
jgi:diadenosine tetraphosphate (Ap4A) HIT family hydrolase